MSRWTLAEDAYLAGNFASAPMGSIIAATGRTLHAIYSRAKVLGLRRENQGRIGKRPGFIAGTPFRKGGNPHKTNLRDAIIRELVENGERTVRQLRAATGSSSSAIWKACYRLKEQNNLHVARWQPTKNSPGNIEAVYRIGAGEDAEKPDVWKPLSAEVKRPPSAKDHEPQPIPRPTLGPWGLVWNTTNAGQAPAERI